MKERLDNIFIGMFCAILLPFIVLSIFASTTRQYGTLGMLFEMMKSSVDLRLQILTIGLIPNMFLFYIVNNRLQMNEFTRGFVMITVFMGLGAIIWTQFFN